MKSTPNKLTRDADRIPSIREANEALAFVKRMHKLRTEAEGRAYHEWLNSRRR